MMNRRKSKCAFVAKVQSLWPGLGLVAVAALLLGLSGISVNAQSDSPNDEGYTKKIREYTTEPFFLTNLVDHLPASATVPTPEKILGHIIGAPDVLTYSKDITMTNSPRPLHA
ncbi:MAG TPA: hypothetical protein VKO18_16320 [Terriglobia bacterium]|nr:hypothetical protein [Terriglobia bacterium]